MHVCWSLCFVCFVVVNAKPSSTNPGEVTVVITACNRPSLLRRTWDSFLRFNTYPIHKAIIIEDSGLNHINDFIVTDFANPFPVLLLYNDKNMGQVASIDKAYGFVSTEWIFHCEEDWEFFRPGFIEASLDILNSNVLVGYVWLRAHNAEPRHDHEPIPLLSNTDQIYYLMHPNWDHKWSGFTFNPALRKTSDVLQFYPYCSQYAQKRAKDVSELDVNFLYKNAGIRAAITDVSKGFVKHIGWGHHVNT